MVIALKFFHFLFLFIWVGSLLSLNCLLGYFSQEKKDPRLRSMYFFVDLPSMVVAVICGIFLFILKGAHFNEGWFHMKLTFIILLVITDIITGRTICRLKDGEGKKFKFKILHGLTILFLIGILFSVTVMKARHKKLSLAKIRNNSYD